MDSTGSLKRVLASALDGVNGSARTALLPLLLYDETRGGDLLHTLRVFLEHGCNASRTADVLFLHRSGLLYRLGRIENALGVRLDCFEERVALEIAVMTINSCEADDRGLEVKSEGTRARRNWSPTGERK